MDDRKRVSTSDQSESLPAGERRRLSQIVHDHKGTASVVWHDAPAGEERQHFEIEETRPTSKPAGRGLSTDSLSINNEDTFNPYARVPDGNRKSAGGRPKDLRRLSAWIKLMRQLEESKRNNGDDEK